MAQTVLHLRAAQRAAAELWKVRLYVALLGAGEMGEGNAGSEPGSQSSPSN